MRDLLGGVPGDRLPHAEYKADFRQREFAVDGYDSWKLERRQEFQEPKDTSWRAYFGGNRAEALELIEGRRDALLQLSQLAADHNCRLLRVRVVEFPLSPYLEWELQSLRVRAECGELIRVVGPELIAPYELDGPLPELITLGSDTVYDITYDAAGLADGATRYLDSATRDRVAEFISRLYDQSEDIKSFMARHPVER
ncbi:DUF6879 family protein [Kitasatospora sp. NPDC096077]|uniref:DUF6879 family protein n=1 Tax=Kitasatospora sp. NPDC096077 TaxID=3155544 RepID=UPI00332A4ED4